MKTANAESIAQWIGMAGRLDLLGLRELEQQLRRDWSEESLAAVLEMIARRRTELSQQRDYPRCVYCEGPCDKPFGWFVVERWERGQLFARGHVCGPGCLIATAHAQRPRDGNTVPEMRGLLEPVRDERVIEPEKKHGPR